MNTQQANKRRSRRRRNTDAAVTTKTLRYTGSPKTGIEQLVITDLLLDVAVVSTAGGIIADIVYDIPTASPDWASCQAIYAEYRILAMTVQFVPNIYGGNVAATLYAPFYVVWDATGTAVALASYAAATNYPVSSQRALNAPWTIIHKMDGAVEATFVPTTSAIVDYAFKTFASGLTAATSYGRYVIRWKTQFRGRL